MLALAALRFWQVVRAGERATLIATPEHQFQVATLSIVDASVHRVGGEIVDIDYQSTLHFFERRAEVEADDCPWTRVLYQDDDPELVIARDRHEKDVVLPRLRLSHTDRVLDVGCGVGRWALAVAPLVRAYLGTDFSEGLLSRARNELSKFWNADLECLRAQDIAHLVGRRSPFNRVILSGILAYLNDEDAKRCLRGIADLSSPSGTIIYVREPMGVSARLTLDNFWSDQLGARYSAIYRSCEEYEMLFQEMLGPFGFRISQFEDLYPADLQNRAETSQFIVMISSEDGT